MVPYLAGVIGLLAGGIVALWYKVKCGRAERALDSLKKDHASLKKEHDELAKNHKTEVDRLNSVVEGYVDREEKIREEVRKLRAKSNDPAELNAGLNRLFPV